MNSVEWKKRVGQVLMLVIVAGGAGRAYRQGPSGAEAAIREARARFNAAIAAHDSAGLDRDWSDSITVILSRGGISIGRAAYVKFMVSDFHTRPGVIYVRTPKTISFPVPWGRATEEGSWVGSWTGADGAKVNVGGRYLAQWQLEQGRWLLHAEAYGLLSCSGDKFCREAP